MPQTKGPIKTTGRAHAGQSTGAWAPESNSPQVCLHNINLLSSLPGRLGDGTICTASAGGKVYALAPDGSVNRSFTMQVGRSTVKIIEAEVE